MPYIFFGEAAKRLLGQKSKPLGDLADPQPSFLHTFHSFWYITPKKNAFPITSHLGITSVFFLHKKILLHVSSLFSPQENPKSLQVGETSVSRNTTSVQVEGGRWTERNHVKMVVEEGETTILKWGGFCRGESYQKKAHVWGILRCILYSQAIASPAKWITHWCRSIKYGLAPMDSSPFGESFRRQFFICGTTGAGTTTSAAATIIATRINVNPLSLSALWKFQSQKRDSPSGAKFKEFLPFFPIAWESEEKGIHVLFEQVSRFPFFQQIFTLPLSQNRWKCPSTPWDVAKL